TPVSRHSGRAAAGRMAAWGCLRIRLDPLHRSHAGAILTLSASTASLAKGVTLLAVYAAGLGLPFLASAVFTEALARRIRSVGRLGRSMQMVSGGVMVAMGAAMITGELSSFSYWLLDTFPMLARIG